MKIHPLSLTIASALVVSSQVAVAASFVVQDIRVQGLQRVNTDTVLSYLPVKIGQTFDDHRTAEIIRNLYQSGLFEDVKLTRQGDVLVVSVTERAAIGEIEISGNKKIKTEQLLQAMKSAGIGRGDALNRAALQNFQRQLEAQYLALGYYGVKVSTQVRPLDNGRVGIHLNISEGKEARIKQLKIVGNQAFSEAELLKQLDSGPKGIFSIPFFSTRDKYAKQKLLGDLDALTSFYRDRGYLNFEIASTNVSLSPDKQGV
ncbi:MAG: outer membrane protein assembly factor BamA, partial [Thiothrix nivea]